jgi:ATP-binding cassette subfamily C protein
LQAVQPALQTLIRGVGSNGLWLFVTIDRIVETLGDSSGSPAGRTTTSSGLPTRPSRYADLNLRGVTFGYGPEPVVADLDLRIPYGDHLAIVGPSGVGKSTLAALMSGLLLPQAGDIRIGQVQVGNLDAVELANLRALVPQEAYVFSGSLWENLTYLRPDATEGEMDRVARTLGLTGLIDRIGGYSAEIGANSLSAGERQQITLARAYLSSSPIVILDEATCHLDPVAEARVEKAFSRRRGTLVVIAHRISSARRASRILVMDGARIVLGTHESLIAECDLYSDLVGHWTAGDPNSTVPAGPSTAPVENLIAARNGHRASSPNGTTAIS